MQGVIDSDGPAAQTVLWAAFQKLAKALVAKTGQRLADETHGKLVDFLICVFEDELGERDRQLMRALLSGRNEASYEDPTRVNVDLLRAGLMLAGRLYMNLEAR